MALRKAILAALKEKQGEWVSGEVLSTRLQVSRTAVWKQIKKMQTEGYEVDSLPKRGYRLCNSPDLLSPDEVCPGLTTKVFGCDHYLHYQEIDSTNSRARTLAAAGYPEGTVVVAESQTTGRGRRGRTWHSPANQGIYVSIILRPVLPLKEISRVSLIAAVAVAETLEGELKLRPSIKWPNDILVNDRKIAGILTEAVTDMDSVEYIVAGIGINVNNRPQDFPDELQATSTSALVECGRPGSRVRVLQGLLASLERHYCQLLNGSFARTLENLKRRSMVIGQEVRLDTVSDFLTGQALDIDDNGFLLVRDHLGITHTVISGEITLISPLSSR